MLTSEREQEISHLVHERWGPLLAEVGSGAAERYETGIALPREFLTTAGAMGLQALSFPTDIGGGDVDLLTWGLVVEEVARQCDEAAFPLVLTVGTDVARTLYHVDRPDIIQRYVVPIITGKCVASFAFSEDTDQFSMRTTLRRSGNKCHLSGGKAYITGGLMSDVLLTYARDESGRVAACLIERDTPGVELSPAGGIGFRTAAMGRLTLHDVVIPEDSVVDVDGLGHAQLYLNARRLILACVVTGLVRGVFARCLTRLRDTVRHGQPLIELPNVQAAVGRMHIAIESARAMVHRTLVRASRGETHPTFDPMISAAKHFVTEQAIAVSSQILRLLGGHGYYGDAAYGMYLRDCIGLLSAAGTQDHLEITVGALVAREPTPKPADRETQR